MSTRLDSLESTVGGQGRQLNELANALQNSQNTQKQSNECQGEVAAHNEATDKVIMVLASGTAD